VLEAFEVHNSRGSCSVSGADTADEDRSHLDA
jgi:hypothetical protein